MLLLLIGLPVVCPAGEVQYNLKAVDNYILPGYTQLSERTQKLAEQTEHFCRQPDPDDLGRLRESYHLAMDSWQFMQPIRLGPSEQELRSYRLQFWPDKRQSVSRHLAELLDKADAEALKADAFAKGSVAVQGFSALERLLFASDLEAGAYSSTEAGQYRCRVMVAITRNLARIAREMTDEWQSGDASHRQLVASSATGNAVYADSTEVSGRLFNGLYTQLELMLDQKLRAPLGPSVERSRGNRSESWRSGRSLRNLAHNLDGIRALIHTAFLSRLLDPPLSRRIETQLEQCEQVLARIDIPLRQAVKAPQQRSRVEALVTALSSLKTTLTGELASALEIPIGFNSLDGD
ncbi:MAG: imelysin family protein [Candidatus Thiodiazotropha sp.]